MRTVREHLLAVACVLAGTLCAFAVRDYAPIADLAMIQLLAVVMVAARFSVRASVIACVVGILAFDFFFIPPQFAFAWLTADDGTP